VARGEQAVRNATVDQARPSRTAVALVESKLRRPQVRVGIVERTRLIDRLAEPSGPRVISLVAPPGYGKTSLLAEWAARSEAPVAWLTLDDLDNDPTLLLSYLIEALDRIRPIDGTIGVGLAGTSDRVLSVAVPRLSSELFTWPEPALIILDDAQRVVDQRCLDAIVALIDHLPPGWRIAVAGRSEPDLPLGRYRAQRDLLEIGPADLAMDLDEAAALTLLAGRHLGADRLRQIVDRTEGWAAGIYLATLADGPAQRGAGPGDEGGAARQYVAEYLRSEVGRDLDAEITFLSRTSILESVTPGVAEAVSGLPDAAGRLSRVARRNLLVQDAGGGTYRYHNLLREYLEAELERREPRLRSELHGRASAWYAAHAASDRAIEHALAAGDVDGAGRLVTATTIGAFHRGRITTVDRWLLRFDIADFERLPPLAVIAGWLHAMAGRADQAGRMADIADRASFAGPPGDGSASFASQRAMLRAVLCRNGPRDMLANAQLAVAEEPRDSPWRGHALFLVGAAHNLQGDVEAADGYLAESVEAGIRVGATNIAALAVRAGLRIAVEDWDSAATYIEQSRREVVAFQYEGLAQALLVYAIGARIALHRGDLDGARADLVRAQLVRPVGQALPWMSILALTHIARAYIALSDVAGARQAIREAEDHVRRQPMVGSLTTELLATRRELEGAMTALAGPSSLTAAELRVLLLLPTYLSFEEIGERLVITRNTVKSHAMSIYGKLQASSRGEAVERAVELGLLEAYPVLQRSAARDDPAVTNGE
jgi:LuxR family maltose regulon positive regulatory protein